MDMDFEAPGVTYKFPQIGDRKARGLVSYLLDTELHSKVPEDLLEYMLEVPIDDSNLGYEPLKGGKLWLMPAGKIPTPNYFAQLSRLQFDRRAEDGSVLAYLKDLRERFVEELDADLLLIDTRSGITNSSTLALSELADEAVAFVLDTPEQLDGTRMMLRSLAPLDDPPVKLRMMISRVSTPAGSYPWIDSDEDKERRRLIHRFMTSPSNPLAYTVENLEVGLLHEHSLLGDSETLLLMNLGNHQKTRAAVDIAKQRIIFDPTIALASANSIVDSRQRALELAKINPDAALELIKNISDNDARARALAMFSIQLATSNPTSFLTNVQDVIDQPDAIESRLARDYIELAGNLIEDPRLTSKVAARVFARVFSKV